MAKSRLDQERLLTKKIVGKPFLLIYMEILLTEENTLALVKLSVYFSFTIDQPQAVQDLISLL